VVSGHDTPMPIGRATNSVTALGPLAAITSLPAEPAPEAAPPELDRPPRRRVLPIVLALALLAGLGVAIFLLTRAPATTVPVIDAAIALAPDAGLALADAAVVAELDAAPPVIIDAPPSPPIDARVRTILADARPPVDAAARPIDAATPVVAAGTGKLTVRHHPDSPSFLEVRIDGVTFGRTPIYVAKPLAAGAHVLTLVKPGTGEVVYRKDIVIVDGQTLAVQQPEPHQ
jgi:hypothetical protein